METSNNVILLLRLAIRNLLANRVKSFIIGGILFFGALLLVVGGAIVGSVEQGMARSIQGSVSGHLQLYSEKSNDKLEIWSFQPGEADIDPITDFSKIKKSIMTVENVKSLVPMGVGMAMVPSGNSIDIALEQLRALVVESDVIDKSNESLKRDNLSKIESLFSHVRQMASVLKTERKNITLLSAKDVDEDASSVLDVVLSDSFSQEFKQDPVAAIEYLENKLAPLASDADLLGLRYIGTDFDSFSTSFDRMKIIDGAPIPSGKRGFLFPKFIYENVLKLKNATRMDKIHEGKFEKRLTIANDPDLQRYVRENVAQVKEIVMQLDPIKSDTMKKSLQSFLNSKDSDVSKLLSLFFKVDDSNFKARYDFFYKEMSPLLQMYRISVGDTLTLKAFTKSGYSRAVNVKVYGTFSFQGLEKSSLSGSLSIIDIVSFRDLYGYLGQGEAKEILEIKKNVGAESIDRANAESLLFGATKSSEESTKKSNIIDDSALFSKGESKSEATFDKVYTKEEIENGVALNIAVILKDPKKLSQTIEDIENLSKKEKLGLKAISWQAAAGVVGQFQYALRAILYISVTIIFIVALVVMNNAMMMATLERIREFGTMRAIGAQKNFILYMLMIETLLMGVVFGGFGSVVGTLFLSYLNKIGIPATMDIMYLLFSGPILRPEFNIMYFILSMIIVLFVSFVSTVYPAILAIRVSPIQAMQTDD